MAKEKKIGVKFFLNTRLKPKVLAGVNRYPVYSRVTFNRKNHQSPFEFENTIDGLMSEGEFEKYIVQGSNPLITAEIKQFKNEINGIIKTWYKRFGDDFSLKGLSEIHKFCKTTPLLFNVEFKAKEAIREYTLSHYPEKYQVVFGTDDVFPATLYFVISSFFKDDNEHHIKDWPSTLQYYVFSFVLLSSFLKMGFWCEDQLKMFNSDPKMIHWINNDIKSDFIDYLTQKKYQKEEVKLSEKDPFAKGPIDLANQLKSTTIDTSVIINVIDSSLFL